ncbi:fllagellar rotor protein FliG [Candidatus Scalindua japonica]|uniref:Flagellar motor switch protein FliG n=1 Tax=Candidatus Scalindua japonica TaxID=1284222 RepID=A0A286TVX8_9BACT|nr:FliG C-terminal domain-containing protein [Candidatus Scalindua japonica]GAX60048.1 fllagellar rotor protein FliG [Candidatus Scalindua japonica]
MNPSFTSKEKVAILLLNLGPETAADILSNFGESEIAEISDIIGRMRNVSNEISVGVLNEFKDEIQSWRKSEEIIDVIKDHRPSIIPFRYFKHLVSEEIISILSGEHTQLIALILSYLEPHQSAEVVGTMSEELRLDVLNRMATSTPPPVQIIKQIDELLESKVISLGDRIDTPNERKYRAIAEILNRSDSVTEKTIMQRIKEEHPDIAQEIKTLMFVFEDLAIVEDKALRQMLSETDTNTIALALKTASKEVSEKIFNNMSKRMGDMVNEEQQILGPKPLSEVEAAQKIIVDSLAKLESQGETVRGRTQDLGPMV